MIIPEHTTVHSACFSNEILQVDLKIKLIDAYKAEKSYKNIKVLSAYTLLFVQLKNYQLKGNCESKDLILNPQKQTLIQSNTFKWKQERT